jgi:protein involved in polysaccharide export with SLBB domain
MKTYRTLLLVAATAFLLGALVTMAADSTNSADSKSTVSAPAAKLISQDAAALYQADNYKIRPTDVITVDIADDEKASRDYRISVDGTTLVTYLSKPIKLAGLTVDAAVAAVGQAYIDAKIFAKPQITITVKEFSPRRINVLGQVGKPGPVYIPAQKDMTLVEAITEAGGPTRIAARTVNITRILPDGTTLALKNVDLYGAVKDAKKDIPLQEGDTILLGESLTGADWQ